MTAAGHLRAAWRVAGLAVVILGAAVAARTRREPGPEARARWAGGLARRMLAVMGVSLERVGNAPPGGVLLTPNHLGYLDVLVLAACRPTVFVAKSEVRGWPVFGWLACAAGTCFIDRGRARDAVRVGEEMEATLAAGTAVVVFLEGTSTDGNDVGGFHASLLRGASAANWTLVPVALDYDAGPGRSVENEVAWWGDMRLVPHLWNLLGLRVVTARVVVGAAETAGDDRKELARRLRERVRDLRKPRPARGGPVQPGGGATR